MKFPTHASYTTYLDDSWLHQIAKQRHKRYVRLCWITLIIFTILGASIIWTSTQKEVYLYHAPQDFCSLREVLCPNYQINYKPINYGVTSWYPYSLPDYPNYSDTHLTAASRDYPRGTKLVVCTEDRGYCVTVRVNDFGPEEWTGRQIDLSNAAFRQLAPLSRGLLKVTVREL